MKAYLAALLLAFSSALHAGNVEVTTIETTVSDIDTAQRFYTEVLQFSVVSQSRGSERDTASLRLGEETLVLVDPHTQGKPVPADMRANDRLFQHIAIVVSDMDAAYQRLLAQGVVMVSTAPQTLPESNFDAAGICALYFRDPDGHFLELIQYPKSKGEPKWRRNHGRLFLGIDHSAIVVRDSSASLHFYRDVLGFSYIGASLNYGVEQERLNGIANSRVKITTLRGAKGPGIELLQYQVPGTRDSFAGNPAPEDLLHWRINLRTPHLSKTDAARLLHDPDGHALAVTLPAAWRLGLATEALRQHWPRYLMEAAQLGIFMMVALYFTILLEHPASRARKAIASDLLRRALMGVVIGGTVICLIYSPWGRQSGAHFNSAITLAHLWLDHIEPWDALFYILAQFIGGWLGVVIAARTVPRWVTHEKVNYVVTKPRKYGPLVAFTGEFFISFLLLFVLLQVIHQPTLKPWFGVIAGLLVCSYITFETPLSDMSMNPARTTASAIAARDYKGLWIYFAAPVSAMLLAAWLCRWLIDS